jgi:ribosomal-protein-alanine N-acetyltransferase
MRLVSDRIYIRKLTLDDLQPLLDFKLRNSKFFQPFEPIAPKSLYTLEGQREALKKLQENWEMELGYGFGVFLNSSNLLIGRVNLSNVVWGAWESCTMGYSLDEKYNGQGLTTEAVRLAIQFAFESAGLHRVQAAVLPRNKGSIRVLEKAGFRYDGFSEYYLKINGLWEHHNLYSITREHWQSMK